MKSLSKELFLTDGSGEILTHPGVYEDKKNQRAPNQRAPPVAAPEYTEPIEIVPYDDEWPGYDEPVYDF